MTHSNRSRMQGSVWGWYSPDCFSDPDNASAFYTLHHHVPEYNGHFIIPRWLRLGCSCLPILTGPQKASPLLPTSSPDWVLSWICLNFHLKTSQSWLQTTECWTTGCHWKKYFLLMIMKHFESIHPSIRSWSESCLYHVTPGRARQINVSLSLSLSLSFSPVSTCWNVPSDIRWMWRPS